MSQPVLVSVSQREHLAICRYEEDKAVVRRLRAWIVRDQNRNLTPTPLYYDSMRVDLTAFLRDEKAKIGGSP